MRTFLLTAAVLIMSTATFAQDKADPAKTTAPVSMKTADDIGDAQRKLSGELKNTLGLNEQLIRAAKTRASELKPEEAEKFVKTVESLTAIQTGLNEQLDLVNKATPSTSKEIFAKAMDVNTASSEQLAGFKKELMPEGK